MVSTKLWWLRTLGSVPGSVAASRTSLGPAFGKPAKPGPLQPIGTRESGGAGVTWIRIGTATERLHDGAGRRGLRCAPYSIPFGQPDDSA